MDGIFFLFAGKAYAIFALLFGFSFLLSRTTTGASGAAAISEAGSAGALCCCCLWAGQCCVCLSLMWWWCKWLLGFVLPLVCQSLPGMLLILVGVCDAAHVSVANSRAAADPDYTILAFDTSSYWAATLRRRGTAGFWGNRQGESVGGAAGIAGLGLGPRAVFQTAGLFIAGMLIGASWLAAWSAICPSGTGCWPWTICCFFPLTASATTWCGAVRGQPNILTPGQDAAVVACQSELHAHARETALCFALLQDLTPRLASRPP